jgi:nucleoside-diphosphate-sugar epimerase
MDIFITGATGFVGREIVATLLSTTTDSLRLASRSKVMCPSNERIQPIPIEGQFSEVDWRDSLVGCDVVIHAAARVHILDEEAVNPLTHYRAMNRCGTLNLARQAASAGVKRFIFISSIKVNGDETFNGQVYRPDDVVSPTDAYAISKYEAEQGLMEISQHTGMEIVILRPPLVYGPGVKGNFLKMMHWMNRGIPLPFGAVNNKRSFVSVYNLADLVCLCVSHPNAANQIFLVSDGDDVSTKLLLDKVAKSMGKKSRQVPVPHWLLFTAAKFAKKTAEYSRLCGSLQLDIHKTQTLLNWQPQRHMDEVLRETAEWM